MTPDTPDLPVELLKACPFCGGTDLQIVPSKSSPWTLGYNVEHSGEDCAMTGPFHRTREHAIAAWNCRAPVPSPAPGAAEEAR